MIKTFLKKFKIAISFVEQQFMNEFNDDNVFDKTKVEKKIFEIEAINEFHQVIQKIRIIFKVINFSFN